MGKLRIIAVAHHARQRQRGDRGVGRHWIAAAIEQRPNIRQSVRFGQYTRRVVVFGQYDASPGIGDLVAQKLAFVGGVHRYGYRAKLVDREPRDDGVDIVIEDRRDGVALLDAECRQAVREAVRLACNVTIREHVAGKIQEYPVRVRFRRFGQDAGHGLSGASLPSRHT